MDMKDHLLAALSEQFNRWEQLLAGLNEAQITARRLSSAWSIKDVIVHLWVWQQRTIARMEAALHNRQPEFPRWPAEFDPEMEGEPDQLNAWLYETYREKPWLRVHEDWRDGFLRLLEISSAIAEKDLLNGGRYPWLNGHPLALILLATYDHHQEHLETLLAWLQEHGISPG